jgi:hypothetical protein
MPSTHIVGPDDHFECALNAALHWLPNAVSTSVVFGRWKMYLLKYFPSSDAHFSRFEDAVKSIFCVGFPIDTTREEFLDLEHTLQLALADVQRRIFIPGSGDGTRLTICHGTGGIPKKQDFIGRMKTHVFGDGPIPHPAEFKHDGRFKPDEKPLAVLPKIRNWLFKNRTILRWVAFILVVGYCLISTGKLHTDPGEAVEALWHSRFEPTVPSPLSTEK